MGLFLQILRKRCPVCTGTRDSVSAPDFGSPVQPGGSFIVCIKMILPYIDFFRLKVFPALQSYSKTAIYVPNMIYKIPKIY